MEFTKIDPNNCRDIDEYVAQTFKQVPNSEFAHMLLLNYEMDWDNSFKAVDDNGKLLGFILFSNATIEQQCPPLAYRNPGVYNQITNGSYTTIFLIGYDREMSRAGVINANMIFRHATGYLEQFDYIILSIFDELTTHRLWKKMGAIQICKVPGGVFYVVPAREKREELLRKIREDRERNGKTVIINESMMNTIKDLMSMTQFKFKSNIKKFLASLLEDPVGTDVDAIFKYNGLDKNKLIKSLVDNKVIKKQLTIDDHDADGNPHTAKMIVRYSVPKERFNDRLDALYGVLFPDVPAIINEEEGGPGPGAFGNMGINPPLGSDTNTYTNDWDNKKKGKKETAGGDAFTETIPGTITEAITGEDVNKSAALYVYNEDRDHNWYILCARRSNKKDDEEGGKWNPPMGHLHKGETLKEGALRECLEESGIDFSKYTDKLVKKDSHNWGSNFVLQLGDYVNPSVTIDDFEPKKGDEENSKFIWLPLQDIDKKTWAWTCGENAKKFIPGEIDMDDLLTESLIDRIISNILQEATADGTGGLPGAFTAPAFIDKETADRTPGDTCGMHDRVGNSNLEEGRKKVCKNDKGEIVPDTCTCGGHIGLYICGEPVYKCAKCGKYYGTMPFPSKKKSKK